MNQSATDATHIFIFITLMNQSATVDTHSFILTTLMTQSATFATHILHSYKTFKILNELFSHFSYTHVHPHNIYGFKTNNYIYFSLKMKSIEFHKSNLLQTQINCSQIKRNVIYIIIHIKYIHRYHTKVSRTCLVFNQLNFKNWQDKTVLL